MTASEDFDRAIEASHRALDEIARGDPSAFFELYSEGDDATLANPFGPPARGRSQIRLRRPDGEPHRTTATAEPSSSRPSRNA